MSFDDAAADFGPEDRGRFRHEAPAGDLTYEQLEERVLAALTDDEDAKASRTLAQIKRHAGLSMGFDLSPVLDGMKLDKKIFPYQAGEFVAYYRTGDRVKRAWLSGGKIQTEYSAAETPDIAAVPAIEAPAVRKSTLAGGIDPERLYELAARKIGTLEIAKGIGLGSIKGLNLWLDEHPPIRERFDGIRRSLGAESEKVWDETSAAMRREAVIAEPPRSDGKARPDAPGSIHEDEDPVDEPEEELEMQTSAAAAPARATAKSLLPPRNRYPIPDLEQVRELAKTCESLGEAAEKLDLPLFVFKNYLSGATSSRSGVREAWYEAREVWKQNKAARIEKPVRVKREPRSTAPKGIRANLDLDRLEKLAATTRLAKDVAIALGWADLSGLGRALQADPEARAAYDRGRKAYAAANGSPRRKPLSKTVAVTKPSKRRAKKDAGNVQTAVEATAISASAGEKATPASDAPQPTTRITVNPADICFRCLTDLPEKPIEINPFGDLEPWAFCSEACKTAALTDIATEIKAAVGDNAGASDNDQDTAGEDSSGENVSGVDASGSANGMPKYCGRCGVHVHAHDSSPEACLLFADSEEAMGRGREPMRQEAETPNQIEDLEASWQKKPVQHTHVTFAGGSQAMIAFEGNFFELTADERRFMNEMTERFQRYPEPERRPQGWELFMVAEIEKNESVSRPTLWQRVRSLFPW